MEGAQVYCPKIGWINLRLSRPVEGVTKSASFKRDSGGHWHVCLLQEFELTDVALPAAQNPADVDVGLISFATLSTGIRKPNGGWRVSTKRPAVNETISSTR